MHVLNSGMPVIVLNARLLYSSCRSETCTKGNKLELDRSLVQDQSSMIFIFTYLFTLTICLLISDPKKGASRNRKT